MLSTVSSAPCRWATSASAGRSASDAGRVGDGLDVEDPRPGRGERRLDRVDVGGVDVRDVHAEPPERGGRLGARRPVAHLPDDQPVARAEDRQERSRGSRPCRSRARSPPRRRAARRPRRPGPRPWGCRSGCRRSRAARRSARRRAPRRPRGERRRLVDRDRGRRLAHDGLARRRPDGARGRARPGSLVVTRGCYTGPPERLATTVSGSMTGTPLTRSRPARLERYIAASAHSSRARTVCPSCG